MAVNDQPNTAVTIIADKAMHTLEFLKELPSGEIVYDQVAQILNSLGETSVKVEYAYASMLHSMFDIYLERLPEDSIKTMQVRLLQWRLRPPLLWSDIQSVLDQFERLTDKTQQAHDINTKSIESIFAQLSPKNKTGEETEQAPNEFDSGNIEDKFAGQHITLSSQNRDGYEEIKKLHSSLSQEIQKTTDQNQQFGNILKRIVGDLKRASNYKDVEKLRAHIFHQAKVMYNRHHILGDSLGKIDSQLRDIELDYRQLDKELSRARLLSLTDELTELPNRRAFLDRLEDEVGRVQRYKLPLSLAIIDLDDFKHVNDQYGHATGDDVLRCYANEVFPLFRQYDMVARYGGEEFAVLLPNTDKGGALCALQKLKLKVIGLKCQSHNQVISLPSFSAGLAVYKDGESATSYIERADKGMYKAKSLGRNRVVADAN